MVVPVSGMHISEISLMANANHDHDDRETKILDPKDERSLRKKMYQQRFIQHNYHDHSQDMPVIKLDRDIVFKSAGSQDVKKSSENLRRRGVNNAYSAQIFPVKLHKLLEAVEVDDDVSDIVSWQIHGRAFKIHRPKEFTDKLMPLFFKQTKMASFRRQLNLYGFLRITQGKDKGAYYHELFLRGKEFLSKSITRERVKGTFVKGKANPATEPDFYGMPFVMANDKAAISTEQNHCCCKGALSPTPFPLPAAVFSSPSLCETQKDGIQSNATQESQVNVVQKDVLEIENMIFCLQDIGGQIFDDWDLNTISSIYSHQESFS
jgi:hypothetical protein